MVSKIIEESITEEYVSNFIHLILTTILLLAYIYQHKFLIDKGKCYKKSMMKKIWQTESKANSAFTDFVNKMEIWKSIE